MAGGLQRQAEILQNHGKGEANRLVFSLCDHRPKTRYAPESKTVSVTIFTNSSAFKPVFRAKATASPRLSIMANRRKLLPTFTRFACAAGGPSTKVFLASASNKGEQRSIPSFGPAATMTSRRAAAVSGRPNTGAAT